MAYLDIYSYSLYLAIASYYIELPSYLKMVTTTFICINNNYTVFVRFTFVRVTMLIATYVD